MDKLVAETPSWIKRKHFGKRMTKVNFKKFLEDEKLKVEDLMTVTGYTLTGVVEMLKRGTIKPSIAKKIIYNYPRFKNYRTGGWNWD